MPVFFDNSLSIGHTPLIRLNRVTEGAKATVLAKIEGRNPAYSVKCRIGASMIWDAEKRGILKPGKRLVEPTSGNTGIALAFVAAARGYPITLTMPDTMSIERRKVLRAFGAKLELTEGAKGMKGAIAKAEEIYNSDPAGTVLLQQFQNPANPQIHFDTTGPEIWDDTEGAVDVIVSGVGTGGTITGISRFLKQAKGKAITSVAVEPANSPVITQVRAGQPIQPGPHKIQGLGAGFIPGTLDLSIIDRVEQVTNDESMEMARRLAREEGILSGISCGQDHRRDSARLRRALSHVRPFRGPDQRLRAMSRIRVDDLHKVWMKDPSYRREYDALGEEFALVASLIEARTRAGLTQEQVAHRMKTTQAVIARLESGGSKPSTRTLERFAAATGSRLKITFEPENART
jgi:cysteine synthase A